MEIVITEADRRELAAKHWPLVKRHLRKFPVWYQKCEVEKRVRRDIERMKREMKPEIEVVQSLESLR